jgi:hypothetical protein
MWLSNICEYKCSNAKVPPWRFLMKTKYPNICERKLTLYLRERPFNLKGGGGMFFFMESDERKSEAQVLRVRVRKASGDISKRPSALIRSALQTSTENNNISTSKVSFYGKYIHPCVLPPWLLTSNWFVLMKTKYPNICVRIFIFLSRKFFFQNLTFGYIIKTLNQIIF